MIYRPASPEDAEGMSRLILSFRESYMAEPGGAGAEKFLASVSTEAERGYVLSSRYRYLVADANGELAGFVATRDDTHVFRLFVSRHHQNRGVARELWRRVLDVASGSGVVPVFTVNSSILAVPVYERFGFVKISGPVRTDGIVFVPMQSGGCRPAAGNRADQ